MYPSDCLVDRTKFFRKFIYFIIMQTYTSKSSKTKVSNKTNLSEPINANTVAQATPGKDKVSNKTDGNTVAQETTRGKVSNKTNATELINENTNTQETPIKKRGRPTSRNNEEANTTTLSTTTSTSKSRSRSVSTTKRKKIEKLHNVTVEPEGYSDPNASLSRNRDIARFLVQIANEEADNVWKFRSLDSAASLIRSLNWSIKCGEQAQYLPSIGANISQHIDDFIKDGFNAPHKIEKSKPEKKSTSSSSATSSSSSSSAIVPVVGNTVAQQQLDERANAIAELCRCYGIGEVKAKLLYDKYNIKSLQQLHTRLDLLNPSEKIGLKYVDELEQKIPVHEVKIMENIINYVAKQIDPKLIVQICGSYRRQKPEMGDVDVLITHPDYRYTNIDNLDTCTGPKHILATLVASLQRINFVTDILGLGSTKFMGIVTPFATTTTNNNNTGDSSSSSSSSSSSTTTLSSSNHIHRRIDIRLVPYNSWHFAVFYFTGSRAFNIRMRNTARSLNYMLNEYSIRPILGTKTDTDDDKLGNPIEVSSEQDIFRLLKLPYLEPSNRIG